MKVIVILCLVVIFASALIGLFHVTGTILELSVIQLNNGIKIDNLGKVDCLVFVNSPDGEQQFELAIGGSLVIINISQPVEISAISK